MTSISPISWIVLIIIVLFIIGINVWLFSSITKKKEQNEFQILKQVTQKLSNPYQKENQQLEELSRLTADLKNNEEFLKQE
jgi:uncharacterized membrane protein YqiK